MLRVETRPISCYLIDLSPDVRAGFCDAHRSQIRTISERLQRLVWFTLCCQKRSVTVWTRLRLSSGRQSARKRVQASLSTRCSLVAGALTLAGSLELSTFLWFSGAPRRPAGMWTICKQSWSWFLVPGSWTLFRAHPGLSPPLRSAAPGLGSVQRLLAPPAGWRLSEQHQLNWLKSEPEPEPAAD